MYDYEDENKDDDLFGDAPTAATKAQIDFRAELNDDQYAAVTAPDGPAIVLAGAGSGKTRTLTYRVAYLLTQGALPEEILLLTFTNKASREMLGRVEHLTGVASHQSTQASRSRHRIQFDRPSVQRNLHFHGKPGLLSSQT